MEKLYISVMNGSRPYINDKGEIVIDLKPNKINVGSKEISTDPVEFRVVDSYNVSYEEKKHFHVTDRGFFKVNKNHELQITRRNDK